MTTAVTTTMTKTIFAKRDWLVDEMCFKYVKSKRAYVFRRLLINPDLLVENESVNKFKDRVMDLMAGMKLEDDLCRVLKIRKK